jgi:hypothetical protein
MSPDSTWPPGEQTTTLIGSLETWLSARSRAVTSRASSWVIEPVMRTVRASKRRLGLLLVLLLLVEAGVPIGLGGLDHVSVRL